MFRSNFYEADFEARQKLDRWARRAERSRELLQDPGVTSQLQQEIQDPAKIGLNQCASDELDPEELMALHERSPLVFDWDRHEAGEPQLA